MLIPKINGKIKENNGTYFLTEKFVFNLGFSDVDKVFSERVRQAEIYAERGETEIVFVPANSADFIEGEYCLTIEEKRIVVSASGKEGYSNALTTLFQLLVLENGKIRYVIINDKPKFAYRGVMIDICRHFFEVLEIKKIIEQCALLKINIIRLHISDDQGYRIESERFPKLNEISSYRNISPQDPLVTERILRSGEKYGGYYTKTEIKELVNFASARGIEIVPDIDVPGHSSAILAAFPKYTCSKKPLSVKGTFGVHNRLWCVGDEKCFKFIEELVDEIDSMFPSKYFHIGGDEVPKDEWKKCEKCGALAKRLGGCEELCSYFSNRIASYIKKIGRTAIVWNDCAASGKLAEDIIVQYWAEMSNGKSRMLPEISKGRKFILSDMNRFYCDYSYAEVPLRSTLMYEPNIKDVLIPEVNVLGIEAPMWTEWTAAEESLEKQLFPRLTAVAECGWTKQRNIDDFLKRAKNFVCQPALVKLRQTPWEEATVSGDAALNIIAEKMLLLSQKYHSMKENDESEISGEAVIVETENSEKHDAAQRTIDFMTEKMKAAYSKEDVQKVLKIMNGMRGKNV